MGNEGIEGMFRFIRTNEAASGWRELGGVDARRTVRERAGRRAAEVERFSERVAVAAAVVVAESIAADGAAMFVVVCVVCEGVVCVCESTETTQPERERERGKDDPAVYVSDKARVCVTRTALSCADLPKNHREAELDKVAQYSCKRTANRPRKTKMTLIN